MCASTRLSLAAAAASAVLALAGGAPGQTPSAPAMNAGSPYTNSLDYQRWWWTFQQRAYPLGYIPLDGLSWQLLAASTFGHISFSRLKVNPTNSGVLLSANTRGFSDQCSESDGSDR
jgi:hypothetical protein